MSKQLAKQRMALAKAHRLPTVLRQFIENLQNRGKGPMKKHSYFLTACVTTVVALGALALPVKPGLANLEAAPKALIDEVWQVVDHEYVDTTFNHQDWSEVRRKYLAREYKTREAAYRGIREMLKTLADPYTRFMEPKQYESMQVETSGEFQGVGIQLSIDEQTRELTVLAPMEDTPAYTAGVKTRDVLLAIDDRPTKNLDIDQAVNLIRGKGGTIVNLKFRRDKRNFTLALKRVRIELKPVKFSMRTEGGQAIGYIRLSQFNANAARDMRQAIAKLTGDRATGFVLDLRNNPGGLLYASAEIARLWLSEGAIVSTVDRNGQRELMSANRPAATSKPLVVLVDGGSASASEILSGALQDNHRATLIGTKTFGKGLVQAVHTLSDGSGMAVTIAHYQTPSGRDINKKGIEPDYPVEIPRELAKKLQPEQLATAADPQYARAIEVLEQRIAERTDVPAPTTARSAPDASTDPSTKAAVPMP